MKNKCIICGDEATRKAEIGVCLEHWEGESRDTGATIELCGEHATSVIPLLILDND
jgi:hypothetical protein